MLISFGRISIPTEFINNLIPTSLMYCVILIIKLYVKLLKRQTLPGLPN